MRDLFAQHAIDQVPKLLTLLDRNPHSPTFGCFDRNFWHYKIIDFPSGMAQEFVWPLALAYDTDCPNNPYHGQPNFRGWVEGGIAYAARSAHADGSCDDYFPFERAAGAAAFSLLACIESYTLLGLQRDDLLRFFEKRADWLAHHDESGRLTNHQALIVLCLELAGRLLRTDRWREPAQARLQRILDWQTDEGWFPEYEGFDPGYQTLTIWCLARVLELKDSAARGFAPSQVGDGGHAETGAKPQAALRATIERAVDVCAQCVHPDGSFAGEYASRNTYNFFPAGFELVGRWKPDALAVNDQFLRGLASGLGPCYADDHIIGHHTWNYLLAWRSWVNERPTPPPRQQGRIHLQKAKLIIERRGAAELYVAPGKGGVFKSFRSGRLVVSDTQVSLSLREGGKVRNAVAHLVGDYDLHTEPDRITIRGQFGYAKQAQMTPPKLIILRVVMLTVGRFFPNLIRRLLQKMLITGKKPAPFSFTRTLEWRENAWHVRDEVRGPWSRVIAAGIGSDQTSIYVVMGRTFQRGQLLPWVDLTDRVRSLRDGEALVVERNVGSKD